MSYRLWLDDVRPIPDPNSDWVHAWNPQEFMETITQMGLPYYISFDHDLGGTDTGMTCAHWLIDNDYPIPEYDVHSQNPVGTRNIIGLLENYKQFKLKEQATVILLEILKDLGDRGGFKFSEVWATCPLANQQEMLKIWTQIIHNGMKLEIEKAIQPFQKLIRR